MNEATTETGVIRLVSSVSSEGENPDWTGWAAIKMDREIAADLLKMREGYLAARAVGLDVFGLQVNDFRVSMFNDIDSDVYEALWDWRDRDDADPDNEWIACGATFEGAEDEQTETERAVVYGDGIAWTMYVGDWSVTTPPISWAQIEQAAAGANPFPRLGGQTCPECGEPVDAVDPTEPLLRQTFRCANGHESGVEEVVE